MIDMEIEQEYIVIGIYYGNEDDINVLSNRTYHSFFLPIFNKTVYFAIAEHNPRLHSK